MSCALIVNIRGHEANFYEAEARYHEEEIEAEARKNEAEAEDEVEWSHMGLEALTSLVRMRDRRIGPVIHQTAIQRTT